jgi:DNA-binding transcriptional LysR family regulator
MRTAAQWESRIGRRMRLRDLHIFLAVIRWGSMAKAAADLGMAQPSVSEAIADLEHALGARLLDRTPRGVAPTAFGKALLRRGQAAFDELRQGVEEIEHLTDPTAGEIRVSCPETLTAGFLPAIIDRLSRDRPRLTFEVFQENVASRFRELRERNVDLALARLLEPLDDDDLEAETLFDDRMYVVAGAANSLTRRRKIKLAELADEPWIAIPSADSRSAFSAEIFRSCGLKMPRPTVVTFSQHVRYHLLAKGRHITTLPASALHFNAEYFSLKVLPVELPYLPRPIVIVTVKNRMVSPAARLFIDCAREAAKSVCEQTTRFQSRGIRGNERSMD